MLKFNKILFAATIFLFTSVSYAQSTTSGTLVVDVNDGSNNVASATVSVENTGTGLSRSGTTNSNGSARLSSLPPGTYVVTVSASGYANNSAEVSISTGVNAYTAVMASSSVAIEDLVTTASFIKANAYEINETGLNLNVTELATQIPVSQDLTSLTLLAPGAVEGDAAFGFLPSFSGSSVGENQYLVNGLNTTNFRNFIGYSDVPFEFYETVDVKTGGFQAQYGKAIGGFVTATTKRGSNEFKSKVTLSIAPDSLRDKQPNTYASANQLNTSDSRVATVSVSGPIIRR